MSKPKSQEVVRLVLDRRNKVRFPAAEEGMEATVTCVAAARRDLFRLGHEMTKYPELQGKRVIMFADVSVRRRGSK